MPLGGYGGFIPPNIGGGIVPQKDRTIELMGGLLPSKGTGMIDPMPQHGGINPGAGMGGPNLPPDFVMPTPMGGLPPGIPPVQGPGSIMGVPPVRAPRPSPIGGLPGGNGGIMGGQDIKRGRMNSTLPPMRRNGGVGGVAPRPAQGNMMRKQRGRGGMSMF